MSYMYEIRVSSCCDIRCNKTYCLFSDSCDPPCRNGGTCIGNNTCVCSKGYTGSVCNVRMYQKYFFNKYYSKFIQ